MFLFLCIVGLGLAWYINRTNRPRNIPPWLPLSELSPMERLLYPIVGHALFLAKDPDHVGDVVQSMGGTISLMSANQYVVCTMDPAVIQQVSGPKHANHPGTPRIELVAEDGDVFLQPYNDVWKRGRKFMVNSVFGGNALRNNTKIVELEADYFLKQILTASKEGKTVPFRSFAREYPFHVMLRICFGVTIEDRINGDGKLELLDFAKRFSDCILTPGLSDLLPGLKAIDPLYKKCKKLRAQRDELFRNSFKKHRENFISGGESFDLVDTLLQAEEDGKLAHNESVGLLHDIFFAGLETSYLAVNALVYFLADYPEVQTKCQEEIARVIGSRPFKFEDTKDLPYFSACVKEMYRLQPLNNILFAHLSKEDTKVNGWDVPANTPFFVMPMMRCKNAAFAADGKSFNPDRFLNNPHVDLTGEKDKNLLIFGSGPRVCPGARLAVREVNIFVGRLLQYFSFEPADPSLGKISEKIESAGFFRVMKEARIKFIPRKDNGLIEHWLEN